MDSSQIISAWKDSAELQKEFQGDFKRYLSFCDANNRGLIKIIGTKIE